MSTAREERHNKRKFDAVQTGWDTARAELGEARAEERHNKRLCKGLRAELGEARAELDGARLDLHHLSRHLKKEVKMARDAKDDMVNQISSLELELDNKDTLLASFTAVCLLQCVWWAQSALIVIA
jgi:chromosome segregation ATPase